MREDVTAFLARKKFRSFILHGLLWETHYPRIVSRVFALYGFFKGAFSIRECIQLTLLPARYKSEHLRGKFSRFVNHSAKEALRDFIQSDGTLQVYGKPFYPPGESYYELASLLLEVIAVDQYEARHHLRDGAVVIDAGANVGVFSVFASHTANDITVHAFEPSASTFEVLKKNVAPYANISPNKLGLGDVIAIKRMFRYSNSTGGTTFEDSGMIDLRYGRPEELKSEEAETITLDAFVKQNNIPKVDFIKIDTEGYELAILKGAAETIKKFMPVISMSAYHKPGDKEQLTQFVTSLSSDYVCTLKQEYEEDLVCVPKSRVA